MTLEEYCMKRIEEILRFNAHWSYMNITQPDFYPPELDYLDWQEQSDFFEQRKREI